MRCGSSWGDIKSGWEGWVQEVARLADVCRQSIVFDGPEDLTACLSTIGDDFDVVLVRKKKGALTRLHIPTTLESSSHVPLPHPGTFPPPSRYPSMRSGSVLPFFISSPPSPPSRATTPRHLLSVESPSLSGFIMLAQTRSSISSAVPVAF